jgi:hypothetical protein
MDKWLKRIWLVNGILIMAVATLSLSDRVQDLFRSRGYRPTGPLVGDRAKALRDDTLAIQDIITTMPCRIGQTSYTYVALVSKDLQHAIYIKDYLDAQSGPDRGAMLTRPAIEEDERSSLHSPGTINLAFMSDDRSDMRLLTQRKACVAQADIPPPGDTLQKFILYRIVLDDTDGDGRLTNRDRSTLCISDLSGHNLKQVAPDSIIVRELVKSFRGGKLVFRGQIRPLNSSIVEDDWPEQIYTYDVRTGTLAELLPNEEVLNLARRILWKQ